MITGSKIALARRCSWWAAPGRDLPTVEASDEAELGTAFHSYAERIASGSHPCESPTDWPDGLRDLADAFDDWWFGGWSDDLPWRATEIAFALDVERGLSRQLYTPIQRDYQHANALEIPGTADLVGLGSGGLVVIDYKTGQGPHRFDDHGDQMRFLGTAAATAVGAHEVRAIVVHVTPDGVKCDERTLDSLDMAVTVYELGALRRAALDDPVALPGLHCDDMWCPALSVCPTTRQLLIAGEMALDDRRHLPILGPPTNNDEAYAKVLAARALESMAARFASEAKAYANTKAIIAPDGRRYAPSSVTKETPDLSIEGARRALGEALGPDLAMAAIRVKESASFDSIGDAIREARRAGNKIPIKETIDLARESLRSVGALKISQHDEYRWRAAPKGGDECSPQQ